MFYWNFSIVKFVNPSWKQEFFQVKLKKSVFKINISYHFVKYLLVKEWRQTLLTKEIFPQGINLRNILWKIHWAPEHLNVDFEAITEVYQKL